MSKLGKINITIPENVKVALTGNNLNIDGPVGKKTINVDMEIFELNPSEFFHNAVNRYLDDLHEFSD